jgi:hypothetical protein
MPDVRRNFFASMTINFENNCSHFEHVNEAKGARNRRWSPTIIEMRKAELSIQHRKCCANGDFRWDITSQSWRGWRSFVVESCQVFWHLFFLFYANLYCYFSRRPPIPTSFNSHYTVCAACYLPWIRCEHSNAPLLPCPNNQEASHDAGGGLLTGVGCQMLLCDATETDPSTGSTSTTSTRTSLLTETSSFLSTAPVENPPIKRCKSSNKWLRHMHRQTRRKPTITVVVSRRVRSIQVLYHGNNLSACESHTVNKYR